MAHILVTGGAGFIGSHLIDSLISEGHSVTCVDNLLLGRMENIQHHMKDERFTFIKLDLLELDRLKELFTTSNFDCVFHLAANSDIKQSIRHTDLDIKLNFLTTYNVLECMRISGVKSIVFSSTSAIYGKSGEAFDEEHGPAFPVSLYGASKLAAEAYISVYVDNFGIQAWIVRFPNVVGDRGTHGIIVDFLRKLQDNSGSLEVLGDGKQRKPYIYVKELVEAILFIWKNSHEMLNYYNVAPESDTSVSEIAHILLEEMGLDAEIRYTGGSVGWVGDVPFYKYDITKIKELGWSPRLTSNEYVRLAIRKSLGKE